MREVLDTNFISLTVNFVDDAVGMEKAIGLLLLLIIIDSKIE